MSNQRLPVNAGSIVRHKMGGPKMVVYGLEESSYYGWKWYLCRWADKYGFFHDARFTRDELQRLG